MHPNNNFQSLFASKLPCVQQAQSLHPHATQQNRMQNIEYDAWLIGAISSYIVDQIPNTYIVPNSSFGLVATLRALHDKCKLTVHAHMSISARRSKHQAEP